MGEGTGNERSDFYQDAAVSPLSLLYSHSPLSLSLFFYPNNYPPTKTTTKTTNSVSVETEYGSSRSSGSRSRSRMEETGASCIADENMTPARTRSVARSPWKRVQASWRVSRGGQATMELCWPQADTVCVGDGRARHGGSTARVNPRCSVVIYPARTGASTGFTGFTASTRRRSNA